MSENNVFDQEYEIRLATPHDIPNIMNFIDKYWKKGHIMATNRSFFEYEFLENDSRVNFIIAISRQKNTLEGILGFLYSSREKDKRDVWGSIWKVKPGNMAMLGLELRKRMEVLSECRYAIGIGANPNTTVPIIKRALRRKTGVMQHFYILSDRKQMDYKIAQIDYYPENHMNNNSSGVDIVLIKNIDTLRNFFQSDAHLDDIPYKDIDYIQKRYFNHPIYKYKIYGLYAANTNQIQAIVVCRTQECNGGRVLRIVDYVGERQLMSSTSTFWRDQLKNEGYEYIDFFCYGFEEEYLYNAGFALVRENDTNVIPNYFSPFVCENIQIYVHVPVEGVLICKADGDQDRPN